MCININEYTVPLLSYLGDSVIELMVRERLVTGGVTPPEKLHDSALKFVSATAQSRAVENILEILSEEELDYFKRGRNHKGRTPKSASAQEYRRATGMECLFGYLHLTGNVERMKFLFDRAFM